MKQKAYAYALIIALLGVLLQFTPLVLPSKLGGFAEMKTELDREYTRYKRALYQVFTGIDSTSILENEAAVRDVLTKQLQNMLSRQAVRAENPSFLAVLEDSKRLQGYVNSILENLKELAERDEAQIKNPYTEALLSFGKVNISPYNLYRVLHAFYHEDDILLLFLQNKDFITLANFRIVYAIVGFVVLLPSITLLFIWWKRPLLALFSTLLSGIVIIPLLVCGELSFVYSSSSSILLYQGMALPFIRVYYGHMLYPVVMFFACIAFWMEKRGNKRLQKEEENSSLVEDSQSQEKIKI